MLHETEARQNIENEIRWHEENPWVKKGHFLMKWPFVHPERERYAWKTVRSKTRNALQDYLKKNEKKTNRVLVAPCGTNADQDILEGMADEFYGIDVSLKAVTVCPISVNKKVGDILESGYETDYFDAIASFLFFHHLHKPGFDPYLNEFSRILKKGGLLFILEPGNLYFLSWIMSLGRKIFGNVSGLIPDEAPIFPPRLTNAVIKAGFDVKKIQSVSFSHARIPLLFQKMIDFCMKPAEGMPPANQLGWVVLWICKKR